jgi:hypothetical protein
VEKPASLPPLAPPVPTHGAKSAPTQNKPEIPVLFFNHEKVAVRTPRSPRNPPQTHHDLTTKKHQFSKTPLKNASKTAKNPSNPHPQFFCKNQTLNQPPPPPINT